MTDLSSVVRRLSFCPPAGGMAARVTLGFRGPGRFGACLGTGSAAGVEAEEDTGVAGAGVDGGSWGVDVDDDSATTELEIGVGAVHRGHFFASAESSGTSITSLNDTKMGKGWVYESKR
jgi:hypothetical protein